MCVRHVPHPPTQKPGRHTHIHNILMYTWSQFERIVLLLVLQHDLQRANDSTAFQSILLQTFTPNSRMWRAHIGSVGKLITTTSIWRLLLNQLQTMQQAFKQNSKSGFIWAAMPTLTCLKMGSTHNQPNPQRVKYSSQVWCCWECERVALIYVHADKKTLLYIKLYLAETK